MPLTLSASPHPVLVSASSEIEVGPLQIIPAARLARAWGHPLMLSVKELKLLTELARRADQVVGRQELYRLVWKRDMRPGDRSVDVYVRRLRVKLVRAVPGWEFIHTHFGLGYRLSPERSQLSDASFTSQ